MTADGCPGELTERLPAAPGPQRRMGEPPVQSAPVRRRVVQRLDQLRSAHDLGDVERRIRVMEPPSNQGTAYACRRAVLCKTNPHFPVLCITQASVERTDDLPCRSSHHDVGTSTRNRVLSRQRRYDFLWRQRSLDAEDFAVHVHDPCSGVGPIPPGVLGGLQLAHKFLGSPEVVVIEEGEPIAVRFGSCAIAGVRHSGRRARTRTSGRAASIAGVSSVDASSTTMTSRLTSRWRKTLRNVISNSALRFRVGMITDVSIGLN